MSLPHKISSQWLLPAADEEDNPQYTFPDPDLMTVLTDFYFTQVNCYYPILHRPTFERKMKDLLHLRDHRFAATLLMACSLGARHSEDPRVFLEGVEDQHTAGWKWHNQVGKMLYFEKAPLTRKYVGSRYSEAPDLQAQSL